MGDSPFGAVLSRRYPQAWLFAFSVTLFMSALYESSVAVALQGGALLIGTTWYFATGGAREADGGG